MAATLDPHSNMVELGREPGRKTAPERRRGFRVALHWVVYLVSPNMNRPFRTVTRNISRTGFYCVADERFTAGEQIECDIVIPTHQLQAAPPETMYLRCRARVLRVESLDYGGEYGLACRIETLYCAPGTRSTGGVTRNGPRV